MLKVKLYNQNGEIAGEQELDEKIWGLKPEIGLIHEALRVQSANNRQTLAHTKKRGEVRGGGKKPWKQKGTGRARAGSTRSPLWRGGGVIFGPRKERNFSLKMNQKARRKAILMCLSDKLNASQLIVVEKFELNTRKTKNFSQVLKNLPLNQKKILLVLPPEEKNLAVLTKNIARLRNISAASLNVKDLLNYSQVLTTKQGISVIEKTYGGMKFRK